MKLRGVVTLESTPIGFSAALCRGLIEATPTGSRCAGVPRAFSAALCRGLIEARRLDISASTSAASFPRLYAAASLKLHLIGLRDRSAYQFSAALCRGLIEAPEVRQCCSTGRRFSAALCRGLIEASWSHSHILQYPSFSAALCRGLIEAGSDGFTPIIQPVVFRGFMPRPH